jgi:MscS family membrane protein
VESFGKFGKEVAIVWKSGVLGVSLGDVLTALAIFLAFVFLRRIFFRFVTSVLRGLTKRTKTDIDDLLLEAIERPLEFGFVVLGLFLAGEVVPFSEGVSDFLEKVIRSLIAFTFFWAFYQALTPLSRLFDYGVGLFGSSRMQETMKGFFIKLARFVVICLGVAAVFQEWGFNVAALLGSLGLVGMAVALGAQDLIKNMFAGLTIFLDRMFEKGNWIRTPDVEGNVEDIGFRATKVRQFDKALVTIPNSKLASEALINFSRMTNRRIYWKIGVEYRTSHDQIRAIIQDLAAYIHEGEDFETDPKRVKTFIFLDSFGASSIDILLYCFTKTTDWGEWLAAKERLAYKVKHIVEGHGAGFAFPSTSLYVETLPFGKPDPFPMPSEGPTPTQSLS